MLNFSIHVAIGHCCLGRNVNIMFPIQLELLKDRLEKLEEEHFQLKREHRDKYREHE